MSHDARAVANKLIEKACDTGQPLTPLQIIKLVYFCHGWMLGLYGRPLHRQPIEAWRYGPVIADVYHSLKSYGGNPINKKIRYVDEEDFDELEVDLIDQVYEAYGNLSGVRLSQLTHAPGTPWDHIWREFGQNAPIPNGLIQKHYEDKAASQ